MTILTMLSTPILTKIFGDGSLEVYREMPNTHYILFVNFIKRSQNCSLIVSNFKFNLNQGEDTEDWAHYDVAAEEGEVIERFKLKKKQQQSLDLRRSVSRSMALIMAR